MKRAGNLFPAPSGFRFFTARHLFPFYNTYLTARSATKALLLSIKPQNIDLFFFKSSTCCFSAVIRTASLDIHMVGITFIIRIIDALVRLAVYADRPARMCYGACENARIASVFKALTASVVLTAGMLTRHHNIPLAAAPVIVIGTIFHGTT